MADDYIEVKKVTKKATEVPLKYQKEINDFVQIYNNASSFVKPIIYRTVERQVKDQYDITKDWDVSIENTKLVYIKKRVSKKGTPNIPNIPNAIEKKIDISDAELKELEDPLLLWKIIDETHKEGVVGEENNIIASEIIQNTRFVIDVKPTSSNHVITGKPGKGKDNYIDALNKVTIADEDLVETGGTSPKTLDYWTQSEEYNDWDWTGKVLKLTDPSEETINSDSVRTFASGKKESHTVIDQKHVKLSIIGKPAFTITSYQSSLDLEGERRWEFLHVDESEEMDALVIKDKCEQRTGNDTSKPEKNNVLRQGLKHGLNRCKVVIPFAEVIPELFSIKTGDARTKIDTFCDYIASSTVLHQHQRKKDDQGRLISTLFDYDVAVLVFTVLKGKTGKSLNDKEQTLVNFLLEKGTPQTTSEIQDGCSINRKWMHDNKDRLIDKKILYSSTKEKECGFSVREVTSYGLLDNTYINIPYSDDCNGLLHDSYTIGTNDFSKDSNDCYLFLILERINKNRAKNGLKLFLPLSKSCNDGNDRTDPPRTLTSTSENNHVTISHRESRGSIPVIIPVTPFIPSAEKESHLSRKKDSGPNFKV